jgi:hypothetical protein
MTISKKEGDIIIKKATLPFGSSQSNPDDEYEHIDLFSNDALPIATVKEYEIAERIAKKHGLEVVNQDFGEGEGMHPNYKTVYVAVCRHVDEAKTAEQRIRKAEKELEKELEKVSI